jgi:hypothetical protein
MSANESSHLPHANAYTGSGTVPVSPMHAPTTMTAFRITFMAYSFLWKPTHRPAFKSNLWCPLDVFTVDNKHAVGQSMKDSFIKAHP